jgi:hypothetical protein
MPQTAECGLAGLRSWARPTSCGRWEIFGRQYYYLAITNSCCWYGALFLPVTLYGRIRGAMEVDLEVGWDVTSKLRYIHNTMRVIEMDLSICSPWPTHIVSVPTGYREQYSDHQQFMHAGWKGRDDVMADHRTDCGENGAAQGDQSRSSQPPLGSGAAQAHRLHRRLPLIDDARKAD